MNKNTIPFETRSPFQASGIRLGTPAVTTRGMKETEMAAIADMISEVLMDIKNLDPLARCANVCGNHCRIPLALLTSRTKKQSPVFSSNAGCGLSESQALGKPIILFQN